MTKIPLESTTKKEAMKPKKLNAHKYKKMFQIGGKKANVSDDTNDTLAEESCPVSRPKKQRLCSGQECEDNVHQSGTKVKNKYESGELADFPLEVSTKIHNRIRSYVKKLRDHRNRGQNAVLFDGQGRLVKVMSFVLSLLNNMKKPILIIASSNAISLWEIEFSKWSKVVNVVTYKGNKDIRAAIIGLKIQVILSSPEAIAEDMEMFVHIKWELLVLDECQRPAFSTHLNNIQTIMADMKLLTVTGEPVDIVKSYQNFLSLVDCKNENIHTNADMEMNNNISTLKERLSPFIAFECTLITPEIEEYWVPVHLSSMQIQQYCSIIVSNLEALSSLTRKSSLTNVITQIQKCCDHPYLADPTLRNSLKEDSSVDDPLDAEIKISGKLQVLDQLLLEIKRCGLRALVLFQSTVNSEKMMSIGDFLDDLVHQRFGENSYVYISAKILSNSAYVKKEKPLEMFNNVESDRFICLFDYRSCHSSVTLSRVDVVIFFNSDCNPSNDINVLKRITIDSHREKLNVFRLYSAFTFEEKKLTLAKQGSPVDSYISSSVCRQLLAWGAPYLFRKLNDLNESGTQSFVDDLVQEWLFLLRNTSVKTGPTNRSIISHAQMEDGAYLGSILLYGENESHTKESSPVVEYLMANSPSDFWSTLVKESPLSPTNPCSKLSRRAKRSTPKASEGENQNDATTSDKSSKVKGKRRGRKPAATQLPKSPSTNVSNLVALNTRTSEDGQRSQIDQPLPHISTSIPLETECKRIQKELEQITKSHQEKKSKLLSECAKEILEVQKKYDALIHDSETSSTKEIKILEDYQKLINVNKLLAEIFTQNWQDSILMNMPEFNQNKEHKDACAAKILDIPASALVQSKNPCLTGSGSRAPAPHLRSNPSMLLYTGEP